MKKRKNIETVHRENSGVEGGEKSICIVCERLKSQSFFPLNLLTAALWVSEETALLPRSVSTLIQPSVTSTLNSKSFHKLSRSHRATSQIFVFVSLFINLAGSHIQKLDGPRLLRSQRLPLIARKSGKLNAVR